MVTLKICVGVFSGILKARMLELGIHMDNELLYCGIENRIPCSYSSFYLSICLSFTAKFVSQFSPELYRLESSNMEYICRMSDYIVGLRLMVMALIFLFYPVVYFWGFYDIKFKLTQYKSKLGLIPQYTFDLREFEITNLKFGSNTTIYLA